MGTLTPIVMIPMFVGLEITLITGYLLRNKSLFIISIGCIISTLVFSLSFLVANILFLDIDYKAYIIADLPFTGILIIVNVLTIIWLYKPLTKVLKSLEQTNKGENNGN